jgi:hypothetical protein
MKLPEELLSAYLDGELSPAEKLQVEQQLAQDPHSRQILQALTEASLSLKQLKPVLAPHTVQSDVMAKIAALPGYSADSVVTTTQQIDLPSSANQKVSPRRSQFSRASLVWIGTSCSVLIALGIWGMTTRLNHPAPHEMVSDESKFLSTEMAHVDFNKSDLDHGMAHPTIIGADASPGVGQPVPLIVATTTGAGDGKVGLNFTLTDAETFAWQDQNNLLIASIEDPKSNPLPSIQIMNKNKSEPVSRHNRSYAYHRGANISNTEPMVNSPAPDAMNNVEQKPGQATFSDSQTGINSAPASNSMTAIINVPKSELIKTEEINDAVTSPAPMPSVASATTPQSGTPTTNFGLLPMNLVTNSDQQHESFYTESEFNPATPADAFYLLQNEVQSPTDQQVVIVRLNVSNEQLALAEIERILTSQNIDISSTELGRDQVPLTSEFGTEERTTDQKNSYALGLQTKDHAPAAAGKPVNKSKSSTLDSTSVPTSASNALPPNHHPEEKSLHKNMTGFSSKSAPENKALADESSMDGSKGGMWPTPQPSSESWAMQNSAVPVQRRNAILIDADSASIYSCFNTLQNQSFVNQIEISNSIPMMLKNDENVSSPQAPVATSSSLTVPMKTELNEAEIQEQLQQFGNYRADVQKSYDLYVPSKKNAVPSQNPHTPKVPITPAPQNQSKLSEPQSKQSAGQPTDMPSLKSEADSKEHMTPQRRQEKHDSESENPIPQPAAEMKSKDTGSEQLRFDIPSATKSNEFDGISPTDAPSSTTIDKLNRQSMPRNGTQRPLQIFVQSVAPVTPSAKTFDMNPGDKSDDSHTSSTNGKGEASPSSAVSTPASEVMPSVPGGSTANSPSMTSAELSVDQQPQNLQRPLVERSKAQAENQSPTDHLNKQNTRNRANASRARVLIILESTPIQNAPVLAPTSPPTPSLPE